MYIGLSESKTVHMLLGANSQIISDIEMSVWILSQKVCDYSISQTK